MTAISQIFADQYNQISEALDQLRALNAEPKTRSRPLSLAITEIETGLLWLTQAPGNTNDQQG